MKPGRGQSCWGGMRTQSRVCAALLSVFFSGGEGLHHAALQPANTVWAPWSSPENCFCLWATTAVTEQTCVNPRSSGFRTECVCIYKPELLCTFSLVWRSEKRARGRIDSQRHCMHLRRCSVSSAITDPILCRPDRRKTTRKGAACPVAQRWEPWHHAQHRLYGRTLPCVHAGINICLICCS